MDCEANSDVSISTYFPKASTQLEKQWTVPPVSRLTVHLYFCVQDLLCYLIDDGGFLVMSNQKDEWNKVK